MRRLSVLFSPDEQLDPDDVDVRVQLEMWLHPDEAKALAAELLRRAARSSAGDEGVTVKLRGKMHLQDDEASRLATHLVSDLLRVRR